MKEDTSGIVLNDNEMKKCRGLVHYCVLMHWGIPFILHDSTDAYATRQENDHYVIIMLL